MFEDWVDGVVCLHTKFMAYKMHNNIHKVKQNTKKIKKHVHASAARGVDVSITASNSFSSPIFADNNQKHILKRFRSSRCYREKGEAKESPPSSALA